MRELNYDILNVNQYILEHKKILNIDFGNTIKEYRIKNNMSLNDVSTMCLMTSNQMSQIENGKNGVTLSKFIVICNSLGCSPNELIEFFLYSSKTNEDILFSKLQQEKNISKNILEYMISKK